MNYLQAYDDYFWQWEENGEVIGIPNSSTISYRKPMSDILNGLAKGGLPPFGAILLALIATNEQMPENSLGEIGELMEESITENHLHNKSPIIQHLQILGEAMQFLQLLQKLPTSYKNKTGRMALFQCIFGDIHNKESIDNSMQIAQNFESSLNNQIMMRHAPNQPFNGAAFLRDFRSLGLLLQQFPTTDAIIKATGQLPDIKDVEEILEEENETPTESKEYDFIEELIEDDRTFQVGALVRSLWAGLKIPINNAIPSDQKYGGVADLTNKGDFDKLLLSEFANEDIVLMSRLANNEALYLNKETPPVENAFQRIILVDTSIKTWGTPKTLIHALGLAIAKHPKSGEDCQIFALGDGFSLIAYDSIEKVIQAQLEVDIALHPALGLDNFLNHFQGEKRLEIFLISAAATLKLPAMQRIMSEQRSKIRYWIQVDAEGQIDFYKNLNSGKKHLQQLRLNLEELWKPRPKRKKQPREDKFDFPTFYPILYPMPSNPKRVLFTAVEETMIQPNPPHSFQLADVGDIYYISAEKQLFQVDQPLHISSKGTRLALGTIPPFTDIAIGKRSDGMELVLFFNPQDRKTTIINLRTQEQKVCYFHGWQSSAYKNFIFYKEFFYYLSKYNDKAWVIDPVTMEIKLEIYDVNALIEIYKKRQAMEYTTSARINMPLSILKNTKSLFINEKGNLVLNDKHELMMNPYGIFKLELNSSQVKTIQAQQTNYGFSFEDGSKVYIDRAGVLIMESSDTSLPKIYVPLVLDSSLAMATDNDFAGNEYYLPTASPLLRLDPRTFNNKYYQRFTKLITKNNI